MLKLIWILVLLCCALPAAAWAQDNYFQQDVKYEIRVRLDDERAMLHAGMRLDYTNNSPTTLDRVYFHLWPNAYRENGSAFARQKAQEGSRKFREADPEDRGYIDSLDFRIDGEQVAFSYHENNPDIAVIMLPKPLAPGGKISIATPFRVKIPDSFSRLGHVGEQFQLCQWYPKPAVFDRDGWHPMPYLDQGEFYSEFGTYDVYIQVPANYVVGATGDLADDDPEWDWIRKREKLSREALEAHPSEVYLFPKEFPETQTKTLHFHQEKVHDFAWFCDQTYYILADTVQLEGSGNKVRCVAMFTNLDKELWVKGPEYVANAVYDYSRWNGDYPYQHATAVDGALSAGAGMEYPNITVVGTGGNAASLERVIMHEVGHNWYYGILGSNERLHPWMDEGLNTYFENRYWEERHGGTFIDLPGPVSKFLGTEISSNFVGREGYRALAATGDDQPIELHSAKYTSINYGLMVYMKTGQAFRYLEHYLGRATIDKCFHAYYDAWSFRHPQPEDMQAVFEQVSGKDLSWFFEEYVRGTQQLDFRIKKVSDQSVTLQNKVDLELPASLSLLDKEGKVIRTVWTRPFTGEIEVEIGESGDAHAVKVDAEEAIPEFRVNNNRARLHGIFRKCNPLRVAFGYKYPDPDRTTINWLPVMGYNTTDGFMAGLLLHHGFFPKKRFEFDLMPMYGFGSSHLTGAGGFKFRWANVGPFQRIELGSRFSSFSTFARNRSAIDFFLAKKDARSGNSHKFSLFSQVLAYRSTEFGLLPNDWFLPVYGGANWEFRSKGLYGSLLLNTELGGNVSEGLARLSLDARYKRKIGKKMSGSLRGFAGVIASRDPAPYLLQYRVSGSADPFGNTLLLDRAETTNWLSHQLISDHGGLGSLTGASFDRGLLALNGHFKLPVPLLGVFGDVAYGLGTDGIPNAAYWDAGIRVSLAQDIFYINFPVCGTTYGGFPASGQDFLQGFTFTLNLAGLGRLSDLAGLLNQ